MGDKSKGLMEIGKNSASLKEKKLLFGLGDVHVKFESFWT